MLSPIVSYICRITAGASAAPTDAVFTRQSATLFGGLRAVYFVLVTATNKRARRERWDWCRTVNTTSRRSIVPTRGPFIYNALGWPLIAPLSRQVPSRRVCVCVGGSYWSRRAQRGSCALPGRRWGWSRVAAAAAAAGVWCGGGDTHSSSSGWRWWPRPTRTLQRGGGDAAAQLSLSGCEDVLILRHNNASATRPLDDAHANLGMCEQISIAA